MTSDSIGRDHPGAGPRILVAELDLGPRVLSPSMALGVLTIGMPAEVPVVVETVASLSDCIDRAQRVHFDLIVVDESLGAEAEEIVARLRRGGAEVWCWTVDEPAEMRRLVARGVAGIISNRPELALATLR